MKLGDSVKSITIALGIPQCKSCKVRQRKLNKFGDDLAEFFSVKKKTCEHCGKECKKRVSRKINGRRLMVGVGCAMNLSRRANWANFSNTNIKYPRGKYPRIIDKENKIAEGIANAIFRHASYYGVEPSDEEMSLLATKIKANMPEDIRNPVAYATIVTRNFLSDKAKKKKAAPRIEAKRVEKESEEYKKKIGEEISEKINAGLRVELKGIIDRLSMSPSSSFARQDALRYVWQVYGEQMTDQEAAILFPNSTRNQRYKWKERATTDILGAASKELRIFILESISRPGSKPSGDIRGYGLLGVKSNVLK